jgi:hypothetical protein
VEAEINIIDVSWQEPVALTIVAITALIFLWRRKARGVGKAKSNCGCGTSGVNSKQRIIYRARKGERPEVVVKAR